MHRTYNPAEYQVAQNDASDVVCCLCNSVCAYALEQGELKDMEGVPVRVHDQCLTSEVLGSLRCDCKQQLELALDYIIEHGGCIIYMQQVGGRPQANPWPTVPKR